MVRFGKWTAALIVCLGLTVAETGWSFSMGNGGNQPTGPQYYSGSPGMRPGMEAGNPNSDSGYELGSSRGFGSGSGYPANAPQQFNFGPQGPAVYGGQQMPPNTSANGTGYGQQVMPIQSVQPPIPDTTPGYGGAPSYGSPQSYGAAPQGYGIPQGYGGAPGYGPPQGYGGAPSYGPPPGYGGAPSYGPPPGYGDAPGYGGDPGYGSPAGYDNDNSNSNGGRGPFSGMPSPMRVMPNPMQMFGGNRNRD